MESWLKNIFLQSIATAEEGPNRPKQSRSEKKARKVLALFGKG